MHIVVEPTGTPRVFACLQTTLQMLSVYVPANNPYEYDYGGRATL